MRLAPASSVLASRCLPCPTTIPAHRRRYRRRRCRRRRRTRTACRRRSTIRARRADRAPVREPPGDDPPAVAARDEGARAAGAGSAVATPGRGASDADIGARRPAWSGSATTSPAFAAIRVGDGFVYRGVDGKRIRNAAELRRIRALAIPPAYEDVWICPRANGHLQATGRDARGRKQYRYHPDWRLARDADKFERMLEFGAALPRIRKRVKADLAAPVGATPGAKRCWRPSFACSTRPTCASATRNTRATNQLVRPDDAAQPPRRGVGRAGCACAFAARAARSTRSRSTIRASPASSGAARRCPARSCSSTSTRTARPRRRLGRRQRLHPRHQRRRLHGQGLSHLARHGARARAVGRAGRATAERRPSAKELLAEVAKRLGNTIAVCKKSYVHPRVLEVLATRPTSRCCAAFETGPRGAPA